MMFVYLDPLIILTMSSRYKTMFRGVEWGMCYYKERPWNKVYVDCDSLIFKYMLDYVSSKLVVGSRLKGMNSYDTGSAMRHVLKAVAVYSEKRLETALKRLDKNHIEHTIVFGSGNIGGKEDQMRKYAERRRKSFKSIERLKGLYADSGLLKTSITKYILSERDEVRNMVMAMVRRTIDPKININTEPDIACPKECPNIMSYDYDLFLSGARCLIKERGHEDV